jgi:RNA polymerase subunit RPABC4/transcription elongation factor Spt4
VTILLLATLLAASVLVIFGVPSLAEENGTLRGTITIVGQEELTGGEVVVSFAGTDEAAGTASFDAATPDYTLELEAGDYTVYAWARVFHESDLVSVTIVENGTTWANLTVVRIEEIIGTLVDNKGVPVGDAALQLFINDTIVDSFVTDVEGKFRPTISPGTYVLKVVKRGYPEHQQEITIAPGQVLDLDLVVKPLPKDGEEDEFPLLAFAVILFIFVMFGGSFGYANRQARLMRRARMEAEEKRTRDLACPECAGRIPEGETRCPECDHVLQDRCFECGRMMDSGTPECPECGNTME